MTTYSYKVDLSINRLSGTRQKVPAIKLIRSSTGLGLKDSKHFVEEYEDRIVSMLLSAGQFARFTALHNYGQLTDTATGIRVITVESIAHDGGDIVDLTANGTQ